MTVKSQCLIKKISTPKSNDTDNQLDGVKQLLPNPVECDIDKDVICAAVIDSSFSDSCSV